MSIPNDIKILFKVEKHYNVVSLFKYKNTSAWISIKELLTVSMYDKNIRIGTETKKGIMSIRGLLTIINSLKAYIGYIKEKKRKNIFLGASTGLFRNDGKVLDSYFPYYDMETKDAIYMFNCGNLNELVKYKDYTKENRVVIENYLLVILKKLLSKLIIKKISKQKKETIELFSRDIQLYGLEVNSLMLLSKYAEFIAGYKLYKLFFKFLKIEKAYIVSASTKSDMVAALKSLNIEVIEIQHGIVGKLHRGYNFNIDKNDLLPVVDRMNVYNKFWKDEIINAGYFSANQINIVGRLKYDIVNSNIEALNFKYIVFTGQGAFLEEIIKFFEEADSWLVKKDIKMFYKSHPRELKSEIGFLKNSINGLKACFFYEGTNTTEELIKFSIAHISIFSSCHFDAVYYKNKTYILDVMEDNIMNYYIKYSSKFFIPIKQLQEILND